MTGLFFADASHPEALMSLTAASLERGDARSAFMFADRRCRLVRPAARDFLIRGEALRRIGLTHFAHEDLAEAVRADPTDYLVNQSVLKWGPEASWLDAADRIVAGRGADFETLQQAIRILRSSGKEVAHQIRVVDGNRISGWAVWAGDAALVVEVRASPGFERFTIEPDPAHRFARLGSAAEISLRAKDAIDDISFFIDERLVFARANWGAGALDAGRMRTNGSIASASAAGHVLAIVAVYADLNATRVCIESLLRQTATIAIKIIVIDDCSPDRELAAYLDAKAAEQAFTLLRNPRNLGFVGAVNEALKMHDGGDILLLNSDAVLPPNAIERLRRAVHSAPDIGTATPFSNNGEFTSYPVPFKANPLPSPADVERMDRAFAEANGPTTIPLPNGIGFCLYVKRGCFEALGSLSPLYAPGYGEDIEFCLRAREKGFISVCAADVFVGHHGGRSFGASKRALVMRNLRIVEERFPAYGAECAAFMAADPLERSRGRVEKAMPPASSVRLLVQGSWRFGDIVEARIRNLSSKDAARPIVVLRPGKWGATVEIRGSNLNPPQSLSFDLNEASDVADIRSYLLRLNVERIEIFSVFELPGEIVDLLSSIGSTIDVVCADASPVSFRPVKLRDFCNVASSDGPCDLCSSASRLSASGAAESAGGQHIMQRVLNASSRILCTDAVSEAFAQQAFAMWPRAAMTPERKTPDAALRGQNIRPSLGVLVPVRSAAVDRLLQAMGRTLAMSHRAMEIVVFGACLDDLAVMASGNIFVTGPAKIEEYDRLLSQYDVQLILCPYRTGFFWLFDEISEKMNVRKAYFDWSFGRVAREHSDLAMDPRICDAKATRAIAKWFSSVSGARATVD